MRVSGAILAGGKSRRMNADKAFLSLGSLTVVERLIGVLSEVADETLVVGDRPERFDGLGVRVIPDDQPGLGVVGGLATALGAIRNERCVCVGCDMPFLNAALLTTLLNRVGDADGAIVQTERGYEPLCAAYRKPVLIALRDMIKENELTARRIPRRANLAVVRADEIDARRLFNMNTPEDYERAKATLAELG